MKTALEQAKSRQKLDQLIQDNELFYATLGLTKDVLFRMDFIALKLYFIGEIEDRFEAEYDIRTFLDSVLDDQLMEEEDAAVFVEAVENMKHGIEKPIRFRMKAEDGRMDWYMAEYVIVKDEKGNSVQALGKLRNIQKDRELADKANLDLLTSCLNKGAFDSLGLSQFTAEEEGEHVFYIIDIDNFKAVNDNLGHYFGDIVLKEISSKLKKIFRDTDYIGRIGGDEFAVIMRNVSDGKTVAQKAKEILQAMDIVYKGQGCNYHVSGSVGIALYPQHGDDYETLYQNADIALYHSKSIGKNAYTAYNEDLVKGTMANTTPFDMANRALSHYFDQAIAMDTFNLLFEDDNYEVSIDRVLHHLGQHFGVDRCYIFELAEEQSDVYDNTYEWCADGIEPQIDELQGISLEAFAELFEEANSEGVYYSNDINGIKADLTREILQMQGIKAILHTYIKHGDQIRCVVGYDDCGSERVWKPAEISTLMYASKIIAQFLAYKRAIAVVNSRAEENLHVMDALNFYSYIVRMHDHALSYFNEKTIALIPDMKLGEPCYKVIRGFDQECPDCPMRELREHNAKKVRMVIHNQKLDLHVLVTASRLVSYDGQESVFVSSTDVGEMFALIPEDKRDLGAFTIFE